MAKYYGTIGYIEMVEARPGVWKPVKTEKNYQGDVTRRSSRWQNSSDKINDNINISNDISIIADPYAIKNFQNIKYVTYLGQKWKVTAVEVAFPRLILKVSDVYNEEEEVDDTDGE